MNQKIKISLFVFCVFGACALFSCQKNDAVKADLLLTNGKIWTVDPSQPVAEAVAVWHGKILAVGSTADLVQLAGPATKVMDLQGKLLLPGFSDNHTHFLSGGQWLSGVKLKDAKDEREFGERLARKSAELSAGAWILDGTWDHDNWPGGNLPTAALIDQYVSDRPVFVTRYDGHMSVANSLVLKMAGIDANTPDPPGGVIVRKAGSNEPAGVLKDAAQSLVWRIVPEPSREEIEQALLAAMQEAARVGVTSLQDMNLTSETLSIYQDFLRQGKMTVRVDGRWPLFRWRDLAKLGISKNFRDGEWLKIGGLKGFVDGSLGSSTALFYEPYVQDASTRGIFVNDPQTLRRTIIAADSAGLHIAVHAIGDSANAYLLEVFAEAIEANGGTDHRFRIEHAQHIHPNDFTRFADLGVIACVQPYHAIDDGRWAEQRIGHERCKTTYPFRSFLDNGVKMTFGSDWTVAPLDPILGIDAAVTRRTIDGANPDGWFPEQKISVEEAIEAYTLSAAFAAFDEDIKGSITPGKLADMVVLSQDILTIPANAIVNTEVLYTIVGGKVVFE
ncbi:amidohydrolase, partial [candidate division KSB1 bacterium]|nr:amidohydrolase [candidate division KSB1 bacterium]